MIYNELRSLTMLSLTLRLPRTVEHIMDNYNLQHCQLVGMKLKRT